MKKTMLKKTNLIVFLGLFFLGSLTMQAQVAINVGGAAPDANAMLDVSSINKGVLIPRVDYAKTTGLTTQGLLFYINANGPDGDGFYYCDGTSWIRLIDGTIPLAVNKGGTGTTTQFFQGSVVFAGPSGIYLEDNANFFWDNLNKRLGLGTPGPVSNLHVFEMNTDILPAIVIEQDNLTDAAASTGDASLLYSLTYDDNGIDGIIEITTGIDEDDNHNFEISNSAGLSGTAPGAYNDLNTMMRMHTENPIPGITDFNHQSRARVYLDEGLQAIPNGIWTGVEFDLNTYDEHSEFTLTSGTGSPAYFTATEEGYYQVNARTEFDIVDVEAGSGGYVSIAIFKTDNNGTTSMYAQGNNLQIDGGMSVEGPIILRHNNAPNVSDVVYLQAGEIIEIHVWQDYSIPPGPADIINGQAITYASIHKVS